MFESSSREFDRPGRPDRPDNLGPAETLDYASSALALEDQARVMVLRAAAHWADLHGQAAGHQAPDEAWMPGMETLVSLGGDGTPLVADLCPAELGATLAMSPTAAAELIGDALDLRHRLPRLWARIQAGQVKAWVGQKTARATRLLPADLAAVVDAKTAPWAHGLGWGRLAAMIDAVVIAADPDAAAEAVEAAASAQGVWVSKSNDHGIKDIYIRTESPSAIWFGATIGRIADTLKLLGDTDTVDVRRAKAVGILAQPQHTLHLFDQAAAAAASAAVDANTSGPTDPPADDDAECEGDASDSATVDPRTNGNRTSQRMDPRPPVTLYVHISQDALAGDGSVARVEDVGPVLLDQVKGWLQHADVTVKPVIDLNGQIPLDAYEIPDRLREAVHLRTPADCFPYATDTSRRKDVDHTAAYVSPETGGPPGQTRLANLGPLTRRHHRVKTFAGWQVKQPFSGIFIWKSPHNQMYLVDHTGTQRL